MTEERFIESPQLSVGRLCSRVLFTMYFTGCKLVGREHIPAEAPYILALNHASIIDPPLVWAFFPDPVYFLTKKALHDMPIFGWMCDRVGNIPVRGENDLSSVKRALEYLTDYKRNLGVFIEGTRSEDGKLKRAEFGCAYLALKTGRPVVPAYIHGSHDVLPKGRIVPRFSTELALHIGAPLDLGPAREKPRDELETTTQIIVDAIAALNPIKGGV